MQDIRNEARDDSVAAATDSGPCAEEAERPEAMVVSLEQERAVLAERCLQAQLELVRRMRQAQERRREAEGVRDKLARLKAEEYALRDELDFLEDEKAAQEGAHVVHAEALRLNLAEIEKHAREIEFMKGEIEALRRYVASFKEKVPDKFTDVTYLEGKITQTEKEFGDLFERLKLVGKDLDLSYYQKKQELRSKYAPY